MTDDVVFLVRGQRALRQAAVRRMMKPVIGGAQAEVDGRSEIQEVRVVRRLGLHVDAGSRSR